jgi:integrase
MNDNDPIDFGRPPRRPPWNKGKLVGPKPPLRPSNVWSIRTKLQIEGRTRDLALFNFAIDSKLRGCDVVAARVDDVAPSGYTLDRATVRQKKTGRPVRFELTEQARQAIDDCLRITRSKPGEFLFGGRGGGGHRLTTRQYVRLVSQWVASIGLDLLKFRRALDVSNKGDADLPANRQPASGATFIGPYEN